MAANRILYCLDQLTDYAEFERLSDDLMLREGYPSIEPLGGFKDKGRDAIHVSKKKKTTIFAYSVREDWRAKLAEDAAKIKKHEHTCNDLVFVTTSEVTATQRDEAVNSINNTYGWKLELYSRERLRILLEEKHSDLIKRYPQIFAPDLFPTNLPLNETALTQILIHYLPEDRVLGDWLTLKLTIEGYQVWSSGYKKLGEESFPEDLDKAIKYSALKFIALYSQTSIQNPETIRQRGIALNMIQEGKKDFLIPLNVDGIDPAQLDKVTASLDFISFNKNWVDGLSNLFSSLESANVPKPSLNGKTIAANSYMDQDILLNQDEQLISNCLRIERIPDTLYVVVTENRIQNHIFRDLQSKWAFKPVGSNIFLSLQTPPEEFYECGFELSSTVSWRDRETVEGIKTSDLISELLRKSLMIKCYEKGLLRCASDKYIYFPKGLVSKDKLKYVRPDSKKNSVNATGQRKYWTPKSTDDYVYSLAPTFSIKQNLIDEFLVLVRVRIRIADTSNNLLLPKSALARRKRLCKDWWNNDWMTRLLAVCQYLANGDGKIVIGNAIEDQIIINANPILINSPIAINETALEQKSIERDDELPSEDGEKDE